MQQSTLHCKLPWVNCCVQIKPVTKSTLFRYKWVRDGMPAKIVINFKHNHAVVSSETLSFRRLDPAVRQMFAGYFELGMSAAAAAKYHRQRLETDPNIGNPAIALEDAARNPRRTTVSYLYTLWRESKLKEATTKENDDEPQAVGKWYNEDVLENDVKESIDELDILSTRIFLVVVVFLVLAALSYCIRYQLKLMNAVNSRDTEDIMMISLHLHVRRPLCTPASVSTVFQF